MWYSSCISAPSFSDRPYQLPGPCRDVFVLRPGSSGTERDQIPVVETLPHLPAAGQYLQRHVCFTQRVINMSLHNCPCQCGYTPPKPTLLAVKSF